MHRRLQRFRSYRVLKPSPPSGFFLKENPTRTEAGTGYKNCGFALALFALLPLSQACILFAQDTRTVIEPFFPQLCTTLDAQLQTKGGSLAAADEQKLDTARIQKAIDKCGKGRAVLLHVNETNDAFLSGPLELRPEVTLIVGQGVTLFASRDPALYAVSPGSCGIVSHGPGPRGCKPLISVDHAPDSAIMGDGVIDGRGGEKMLGSQYSWWDLAEQARAGGGQQVSRLIVANYSDNFTLYRITLKNSPNFHVVLQPRRRLHGVGSEDRHAAAAGARNTDGIDPGNGSKNITITHSYIRAGDDNVAIKGGPGGATNMTISHDHFYWGHGMSIGSETNGGVSKIRVFDLSLDGPDNGIRIKSNGSRGGLTEDVVYDDVCIRNSPNPITLDTAYSANGRCRATRRRPCATLRCTMCACPAAARLPSTATTTDTASRPRSTACRSPTRQVHLPVESRRPDARAGATNLQFPQACFAERRSTSNDSTIKGTPAEGNPASCAEKFVPFPQ